MKVLREKRKWKKNWKAESQKQKFYLYHFFPPFHDCIACFACTTQKIHFESYSLLQKFLGKREKKRKVLSEKRKNFWKWKAKAKKIIEKLNAKSKIINFENCKRKGKVLWFYFPTLIFIRFYFIHFNSILNSISQIVQSTKVPRVIVSHLKSLYNIF